ncbi:MAG TPA: hypothetical protein VFQ27_11020 [Xanthobacteraceae bacterium]|nr:hypothetical protein [Xanthobacteraceae bacterium]
MVAQRHKRAFAPGPFARLVGFAAVYALILQMVLAGIVGGSGFAAADGLCTSSASGPSHVPPAPHGPDGCSACCACLPVLAAPPPATAAFATFPAVSRVAMGQGTQASLARRPATAHRPRAPPLAG